MVCIPCIVVPVLLYIWHKFLQPILLRFWNPFGRVEEKKDAKDNTSKQDDNPEKTGEEKLMEDDMGSCFTNPKKADEEEYVFKPKKARLEFPDNLEDFGYKFNEAGELKDKETDGPFEFNVKDEHSYNQTRYEALGEVITEHIYKLLEDDCKLKRLSVPKDAEKDDPQTFIFASDDVFTNTDKLLVLIHGSGCVRAGQWARRLIINDSLNSGTQIPFIKRGMAEGYAVLVLNTNHNFVSNKKGTRQQIKGSENPERHAAYVWKNYIKDCPAKEVYIVAHSFGGVVTTSLYKAADDFDKRVVAIAFTDSVHFINNATRYNSFIQKTINWVVSDKPRDTKLARMDPVLALSSEAKTHELTSSGSFESIFKYFKNREDFLASLVTPFASEDEDSEGYVLEDDGLATINDNSKKIDYHCLSESDHEGDDDDIQFISAVQHTNKKEETPRGGQSREGDKPCDKEQDKAKVNDGKIISEVLSDKQSKNVNPEIRIDSSDHVEINQV